ncbi:unnamed protein product [Mytilus coruscus]|uniref:Zinc-binding loop region of homing endonuclease domain-containing protein n=1 Tax=Mytilus coruscus TaxID=42192 RepID=A0A6J8ETT4_MYTCO|nr:unnamed protein product [Mytilus coruscus]
MSHICHNKRCVNAEHLSLEPEHVNKDAVDFILSTIKLIYYTPIVSFKKALPSTGRRKVVLNYPHISAQTPTSPNTTSVTSPPMFVNTSTHKDPPTFLLKQLLQSIEKQLQVNNTRQAEIERLMTTQGNVIKELASKQKTAHLTPLPITPIRLPTTTATPKTPRIPQPLPDLLPHHLFQTRLNISH